MTLQQSFSLERRLNSRPPWIFLVINYGVAGDANHLTNFPYCEKRLKLAQRVRVLGPHAVAIMTGAFVSPLKWQKMEKITNTREHVGSAVTRWARLSMFFGHVALQIPTVPLRIWKSGLATDSSFHRAGLFGGRAAGALPGLDDFLVASSPSTSAAL